MWFYLLVKISVSNDIVHSGYLIKLLYVEFEL